MLKDSQSVWVVIHMAHNQKQAQSILELLTREGFMARLRPADASAISESSMEVLALKSEAKEARDFLLENGL